LRVAIDVRTVGPRPAGIGQYTRNLVLALAKLAGDSSHDLELDLLGDSATVAAALPEGERCRLHRLASGPFWHLAALSRFSRLGARVYHSPSSALVPLRLGRSAVITVHDLVPALFPETSALRTRLGYRLLRVASRRVGALLAVSSTTRVDLEHLWSPRARVTVVPEAPRDLPEPTSRKELAARFDLEGPFFLTVGTLEPRKNLGVLLEAYARFAEQAADPPTLVIAGAVGWGGAAEHTRRAAESLGARLRPLGFVADADIASLYVHARALIHPARYEGFGLPPLEAMAAGTAVAAAAAGALPEVLGDAALYFDPTDTGALSRLLEHLACDDTAIRDLESRGLERAALFSWDRAARETLEVYRRVADGAEA
jgi:glycosyltransferase involved in cell wall biosynthesis